MYRRDRRVSSVDYDGATDDLIAKSSLDPKLHHFCPLSSDASPNADETTDVGHFLERVRGALLSAHLTSNSIRGSDRG